MGIYEFKEDDALRFASQSGIKYQTKGHEIVFQYCPYCKGGKNRDKGTFSISLRTGMFECKRGSCGYKGNMITLSKDFDFFLTEETQRYYNINNYNSRFKPYKDAKKVYESKPKAVEYMLSRGISEAITNKYEITTRTDNDNVLVFPFKNEAGEMKFVKYRNSNFNGSGNKEWCDKDRMPILFGMNHCSDRGTLVITEGQIDSLSLAECGIKNAVSVPTGKNGFTWIPHCWDWVNEFDEIVVFGDCENGQISLANMISSRFKKKTRIARVEDYQGYKDANDILRNLGKDAVLKVIDNAEAVISSKIKYMRSVEFVNVEEQILVSTEVDEVDELLSGGFHKGQVVLLSGKRGNGKSTFASQLFVNALHQNISSFIYSGELPDYFVKGWMDRQVAGKKELRNSDIDKCNDFYADNAYIYDNTVIDDESDLLEVLEDTVSKKGIQFVVLDNLMTALDDCSNNETLYRAQSNFVGRLAKIAKTYEIAIVLVAHPRKSYASQFDNDDVSGSADITNKVDIVMSYDKVLEKNGEELNPEKRALKVTKNRLTGKLGSIDLFYSDQSKRIVGKDRDFNKHYLTDENGFDDAIQEEIPF